jgi:hypothetical protein
MDFRNADQEPLFWALRLAPSWVEEDIVVVLCCEGKGGCKSR